MRFFNSLSLTLTICLLRLGEVTAQDPKAEIAALAAEIPSCALPCWKTGDAAADCTGDPVCGCTKGYQTIASIVVPCIETACTVKEVETCDSVSVKICSIVSANPGLSYANSTSTSTAVSVASASTPLALTASARASGSVSSVVGNTLSTSVSSQEPAATETSSGGSSSGGSSSGGSSSSGSNTGSSSVISGKSKKKGLSGGAKAGIGIGAALGALLLIGLFILAFWWGRRSKKTPDISAPPAAAAAAPPPQNPPPAMPPQQQYPYGLYHAGKAEMGPGNPVAPPSQVMMEKQNSNVGVGVLDLTTAPLSRAEKEELDRRRRAAELESGEATPMIHPQTGGGERAELEARRRAAAVVHEIE